MGPRNSQNSFRNAIEEQRNLVKQWHNGKKTIKVGTEQALRDLKIKALSAEKPSSAINKNRKKIMEDLEYQR